MDEEALKKEIQAELMDLWEKVLDYCDVAIPDNDRYKKLRSKILRVGNNCLRNLTKYVELNGEDKK